MRCNQVLRELAVPTDARDPAAIDEHLASCSACSAWAERAKGLDRLWQATRPPEPTPHAWDAVWAGVASSLDTSVPEEVGSLALVGSNNGLPTKSRPKAASGRLSSSRFRTLAVIGLISLAQAAAVLLAVELTWNSSDRSQPSQFANRIDPATSSSISNSADLPVNPSLAVPSTVEIEEGRLVVVLIRNQGRDSTVIDRTPEVTFLKVDDYFLMYSAMESLAGPKVAMKE